MNWQSENHRWEEYDTWDEVASQEIKKYNLENMSTWNIWRMRAYYVLLVVVGGLTALHGSGVGDFTTLIGILTAIETELKA